MAKRKRKPFKWQPIKLGAHTIAITSEPRTVAEREEVAGWIRQSLNTMAVSADLPPSQAASTFFHECMHAAIASIALDAGAEEQVCNLAGEMLAGLIVDNPDFMHALIDYAGGG